MNTSCGMASPLVQKRQAALAERASAHPRRLSALPRIITNVAAPTGAVQRLFCGPLRVQFGSFSRGPRSEEGLVGPPADTAILLRVEEVPLAVHLVHQFFNEKRHPLGNGSAVRVTNEPVYLSVRDDRNDGEDAQTLALSASWLPEMDMGEPNNDAKRATPIQLEKQHTMAIFPAGDEDWFMFEVKETGYVIAAGEDVPAELVLGFACFDEKGGASRGRGWSCRLDPGTYTLRVADGHLFGSESVSSFISFPISLSFLKEMDPGEPNGDWRRPTPLELGKETRLAILPAGDWDYFRVELPAAGAFRVEAFDVLRVLESHLICGKGTTTSAPGRTGPFPRRDFIFFGYKAI